MSARRHTGPSSPAVANDPRDLSKSSGSSTKIQLWSSQGQRSARMIKHRSAVQLAVAAELFRAFCLLFVSRSIDHGFMGSRLLLLALAWCAAAAPHGSAEEGSDAAHASGERRQGRPICMPGRDLDRMAARERDATYRRGRLHLPEKSVTVRPSLARVSGRRQAWPGQGPSLPLKHRPWRWRRAHRSECRVARAARHGM